MLDRAVQAERNFFAFTRLTNWNAGLCWGVVQHMKWSNDARKLKVGLVNWETYLGVVLVRRL